MNLILIANTVACVCAFVGFTYGFVKFFRHRKAVYAQMITLAAGCMAFGRLYQVVRLLTIGSIYDEFQLGVVGVIGSLMFLFSANYGAMDSLADDGSAAFRRYRLLPILAPFSALCVCVLIWLFSDMSMLGKAIAAVIALFVAGSSYFNLKHLIFPDVDFGVINCLKPYNSLALFLEFSCLAEITAYGFGSKTATAIVGILTGVILLVIPFSVERGIKRWTT